MNLKRLFVSGFHWLRVEVNFIFWCREWARKDGRGKPAMGRNPQIQRKNINTVDSITRRWLDNECALQMFQRKTSSKFKCLPLTGNNHFVKSRKYWKRYFLCSLLDNNPLECDCRITPSLWTAKVSGTCAHPPHLRGVEINTLYPEDFECGEQNFHNF